MAETLNKLTKMPYALLGETNSSRPPAFWRSPVRFGLSREARLPDGLYGYPKSPCDILMINPVAKLVDRFPVLHVYISIDNRSGVYKFIYAEARKQVS
jgi:hypothetical protein